MAEGDVIAAPCISQWMVATLRQLGHFDLMESTRDYSQRGTFDAKCKYTGN